MIAYRKKFIRIVECWNGENVKPASADLIRRFQQTQPLPGMFCREFHTVLIDLNQDSTKLFAQLKRGTRYEITRARERDALVYGWWDGKDFASLVEFQDYADEFLQQKRQPKLDRAWLSLLADAGLLELTHIADGTGHKLVWHAYHRSDNRATLLYSASVFRDGLTPKFRALIGRANRYHHWQDMLHLKARGSATYDFGGWYHGTDDIERLSINRFKEQFGGTVVRNYICEQALTWRGKLFLQLRTRLLGNAI